MWTNYRTNLNLALFISMMCTLNVHRNIALSISWLPDL